MNQEVFNYFSRTFDLQLLESDYDDICEIVLKERQENINGLKNCLNDERAKVLTLENKIKELRIAGAAYRIAIACEYVAEESEIDDVIESLKNNYSIDEYKQASKKYANKSASGIEDIIKRLILKL